MALMIASVPISVHHRQDSCCSRFNVQGIAAAVADAPLIIRTAAKASKFLPATILSQLPLKRLWLV